MAAARRKYPENIPCAGPLYGKIVLGQNNIETAYFPGLWASLAIYWRILLEQCTKVCKVSVCVKKADEAHRKVKNREFCIELIQFSV